MKPYLDVVIATYVYLVHQVHFNDPDLDLGIHNVFDALKDIFLCYQLYILTADLRRKNFGLLLYRWRTRLLHDLSTVEGAAIFLLLSDLPALTEAFFRFIDTAALTCDI